MRPVSRFDVSKEVIFDFFFPRSQGKINCTKDRLPNHGSDRIKTLENFLGVPRYKQIQLFDFGDQPLCH